MAGREAIWRLLTPDVHVAGLLTIKISGNPFYGSLTDLTWENIPPLAVLTGENGTGKTQLLEVIANTFGSFERDATAGPLPPNALHNTRATLFEAGEELRLGRGDVLFSRGNWPVLTQGAALSPEQILSQLKTMRDEWESFPQSIGNALSARWQQPVELFLALRWHEYLSQLTPNIVWNALYPANKESADLGTLFLLYRLCEERARADGLDEPAIRSKLGEPPWTLLNDVIVAAGLKYQVSEPPRMAPRLDEEEPIEVKFVDTVSGTPVPWANISSGERVLLSAATLQFRAEHGGLHPKLILLDEPDAPLHPAFTRKFINVIQRVFIEARGARVIMTTHAPSTVAMAPEESLFEMRRTAPRVSRASRSRVVGVLTAGLLVVEKSTPFVFVEGPTDPDFYRAVWDLLTTPGKESGPALERTPSVVFTYGGGKNSVYEAVKQLRSHGLTRFHGIVDLDTSNLPAEGVWVLKRYAVENYLYDPITVWSLLRFEGKAPSLMPEPELRAGASASELKPHELQRIADAMLRVVEPHLKTTPSGKRIDVEFVGGPTLKYPDWMASYPAHDLEDAFRDAFGYGFKKNRARVVDFFGRVGLVPLDLFDLIRSIQETVQQNSD